MYPYRRGPIYEPKDSQYRPNSISTLISFFVGKALGCAFRWVVNGFRRQTKP